MGQRPGAPEAVAGASIDDRHSPVAVRPIRTSRTEKLRVKSTARCACTCYRDSQKDLDNRRYPYVQTIA